MKEVLNLIKWFKSKGLKTKSGIMVGIGEKTEEVLELMKDLYNHGCEIMTIGQYLQPTKVIYQLTDLLHQKNSECIKKKV